MFNHPVILACTDFSSHSDLTLKAADKLRRSCGGKLYVAHISEPIAELEVTGHSVRPMLDQREIIDIIYRNIKSKVLEQIKSLGIEAEPVFSIGVREDEIYRLIESRNIDILMMGYSEGNTLEKFFTGSLTQKILNDSPVPVWVVKKPNQITKVVALVDDSETTEEVISSAEELSYLLDSEFEVVSVIQDYPVMFSSYASEYSALYMSQTQEEQGKVIEKIKEKIFNLVTDKTNTRIRVEVTREDKIADALVNILSEDHANLAVMGSHHKNFLDRLLLGSETKQVLEKFEGNIVVLPAHES